MLGVVALRFAKPVQEVESWDYDYVLRNFRAWKYEIEKTRRAAEELKEDK